MTKGKRVSKKTAKPRPPRVFKDKKGRRYLRLNGRKVKINSNLGNAQLADTIINHFYQKRRYTPRTKKNGTTVKPSGPILPSIAITGEEKKNIENLQKENEAKGKELEKVSSELAIMQQKIPSLEKANQKYPKIKHELLEVKKEAADMQRLLRLNINNVYAGEPMRGLSMSYIEDISDDQIKIITKEGVEAITKKDEKDIKGVVDKAVKTQRLIDSVYTGKGGRASYRDRLGFDDSHKIPGAKGPVAWTSAKQADIVRYVLDDPKTKAIAEKYLDETGENDIDFNQIVRNYQQSITSAAPTQSTTSTTTTSPVIVKPTTIQQPSTPTRFSDPTVASSSKTGKGIDSKSVGLWDTEIKSMMKKYQSMGFLGVISVDQLKTLLPKIHKGMSNISFIMNTSPSSVKVGHWVAIYIDTKHDRSVEYYDSFADDPPERFMEDIRYIIDKLAPSVYLKFKINRVVDQRANSDTCGYMAMKFLISRYDKDNNEEDNSFKGCTGWSDVMKSEAAAKLMKEKYQKFGHI